MRRNTLGAIDALDISLGRTSLRGAALANNLANVNTPGYKRVDLKFDQALTAALAGQGTQPGLSLRVTSAGHRQMPQPAAPSRTAEVVQSTGTTLRNDGNNVDVEAEMAMLAQNSIYYQALVQEINSRLGVLRLAITEGRR